MRTIILAALLLVSVTPDLGLAKNDGVHRLGARRPNKNLVNKAKDIGSNNKGGGRLKGIKGTQRQQQETRALYEDGLNTALDPEDAGIIGGMSATAGEFPFYVKFEGGTLCGGSLIAPDTVLTAAHCVDGGRPGQVRIGADQYNNGGVVVQTRCAVSHENFIENDKTLMNDVAIIKLKQPVTDPSVSTIAYNTDTAYPSFAGTDLTVIGFGLTDNNGNVANTLQKLETSFVSIGECMQTYSAQVVTPENHICADVKNAGDCNGDSGGPVMAGNLQVGIVSFGYGGCAADKYQDVYVNVAAYSDWIASYVAGNNCKPATVGGGDPGTEDSGGDTGDSSGGGTDVDPAGEGEEPSDFDQLLNCFTTVVEVVQTLMGGGEAAGGGGGDAKGGGGQGGQQKGGGGQGGQKGGGEEKNNGKRNNNGFLQNFFGGGNEGGGGKQQKGEDEGGIWNTILNGAHALLSSEKVDTAMAQYLGDGDAATSEGVDVDGGATR